MSVAKELIVILSMPGRVNWSSREIATTEAVYTSRAGIYIRPQKSGFANG